MPKPPPDDGKQHSPSAARNREPIAEVLARVLPPSGLVLEVASGTGEHADLFTRRLPGVRWQPTDRDAAALASIGAWRASSGAPNFLAPLALDVTAPWPVEAAGAVVCINLIHISPWAACLGLLDGAARVLPAGGVLVLYGAFKRGGRHTAPSNVEFDRDLRARDPAWGVRDLDEVAAAARARGLTLAEVIEMPNNNFSVIFAK